MRKSILMITTAALLCATPALAFDATLAYKNEDHRVAADRSGIEVTLSQPFAETWPADAKVEWLNADDLADTDRVRYEAGVTKTVALGDGFSVYGRGSLGYKTTTGSDNFWYYTVEPGVKFDVTDNFGVKAGFRQRASVEGKFHDETQAWRFGAEYKLVDNIAVVGGFNKVFGDSKYNGYTFGVKTTF